MSSLNTISIPEEKKINGTVFPLTIAPKESVKTIVDTVEFLKQNLNTILEKLLEHGSILFRGFPVADAKDFNVASGNLNKVDGPGLTPYLYYIVSNRTVPCFVSLFHSHHYPI